MYSYMHAYTYKEAYMSTCLHVHMYILYMYAYIHVNPHPYAWHACDHHRGISIPAIKTHTPSDSLLLYSGVE